jgi:hypothetical protein
VNQPIDLRAILFCHPREQLPVVEGGEAVIGLIGENVAIGQEKDARVV